VVAVALLSLGLLAGCPAQAVPQVDAAVADDAAAVVDAAPADDVAVPDDVAPPDLAPVDACAAEAVETSCGDGCDNDGDGWADADDPDCVTAFLLTREPADGILRWRIGDSDVVPLHVGTDVQHPALDLAQVGAFGFAVKPGFPPGRGLYRFDPRPDPAPGPENASPIAYQASDVCLLGGVVVVAERAAPKVHAYAATDLATDLGPVTLSGGTLTRGCASDGTAVYVVLAPAAGPDEIVQLSAGLAEIARVPLPSGLDVQKTRLLDLAYDRRTALFYGLFTTAGEPNTAEVTPFAMGGAAGASVVAPFALTNLGTYAP
jgi:hypothetical protein